jgi:oligosaccharide repeat unit polymerase
MPEITLLIILIAFILVSIYNILVKDFLNPVSIFIAPITAGYFAYYFYWYRYNSIRHVEAQSYVLFLLGVCTFLAGYFLIECLIKKRKSTFELPNYSQRYLTYANLFLMIGFIGLLINIVQAIPYIINNPSNWAFELRYANSISGMQYSGEYLFLFFEVSTIMQIINRNVWKISRMKIILMVSVWALSSLLTMARTELFLCLLSVMIAFAYSTRWSNLYNKLNCKPIIVSVPLLIFGFYYIAKLTGKLGESLLYTFLKYLGYPLIAFNDFIIGQAGTTSGANTFYILKRLFDVLNINTIMIDRSSIRIGSENFNVFSFIQGPYMDFGVLGIIIVMYVLGMVYRLLYMYVRNGSTWGTTYYCFVSFPLFMSFYTFTFSYSLWIYFLFILLLLYYLPRVRLLNIGKKGYRDLGEQSRYNNC